MEKEQGANRRVTDFFNRKNLFLILAVFLFTLIAYGQVVNYGFVWDDIALLLNNPYLKMPFSRIFDAFIPGFVTDYIYTPVAFMINFVLFKIFGASPVAYHVFNLVFYLLTIVLIYRFFLITMKKQELAFLSTLLFAVHPLHSEIISWVACDGYIISIFFMMVSFNLFLNLIFKDCNLSEKIFNLSFLVVFYIASFLSQPISVVFPALLLVYAFIFFRHKLLFSLKISVPLFALSALCVYLSTLGVASARYNPQHLLPFKDKLVVISQYLVKSIFPFESVPVYPMSYNHSFSVLQVVFYILILLVSVVSFIKINNKFYRFFILWFAVSISPYSHLFNHFSTIMSDRYLYLPSVASSMLLACILHDISDRLGKLDYLKTGFFASHAVTLVVLTLYISASFVYSSAWKDSFSLWNYAYSKNKTNHIILFNLALAYQERNKYEEALFYYDEFLKIDPCDPSAYIGRAQVMQKLGRYDESLESCEKSLELFAATAVTMELPCGVFQDLIGYYFSKKDYEKAWESSIVMAKIIKITSENDNLKASVFCMTGTISYFYGKIDDFINYYSDGVFLLEKKYPSILLSALRCHRDGRYEEAIKYYKQFLKISSAPAADIPRLLHVANLALHYSTAGKEKAEFFLRQGIVQKDQASYLLENHKYEQAELLMKEILSNDPYFLQVRQMLDDFYAERGKPASQI